MHGITSVRGRLLSVTAGAIIAFFIMVAVAWVAASRTEEAMASAEHLRGNVAVVEEMRLANLELVLAAMDSIIDREEGQIQPERAEVIAKNIKTLRDGIQPMSTTAMMIGDHALMATFPQDLDEVAKAIQVDLKKLIESDAGMDEFAKLDDAIDGGGERITESLAILNEKVSKILGETIQSANETAKWSRYAQVGTGLLAILLIAPAMILVVRSITGPMSRLQGNMVELADGKLDVDIVDAERTDEVGDMARAVKVFKDNAVEQRRLTGENEAEQHRKAERQQRIETMIDTFRTTVQELLNVVGANTNRMETTANALAEIADSTSQQATTASAASEQATSNVQTVAVAAEELAASITEIERQVQQTTQIVEEATGTAQATNDKVASLANAAQKIGDVVSLIQAIAEQTNLLALNATIEAARAGEAGKGFAVVASEVKELATQTSKATEEISSQISAIQNSTDEAVDAIDEIGKKIESVNAFTTTIAEAVRQQGDATGEISQNVNQAATGTQQASDNMAGVTSAVSETTRSASEVRQTSAEVAQQARQLNAAIDSFLNEVTAA